MRRSILFNNVQARPVRRRRAPQRAPGVQGVPRWHGGDVYVRRSRRAPVRRDDEDALTRRAEAARAATDDGVAIERLTDQKHKSGW